RQARGAGAGTDYSAGGVSFVVIARSQRVRAKRGPMTGSATKQSRAQLVALDRFASLAMTSNSSRLRRKAQPSRQLQRPRIEGADLEAGRGVDRDHDAVAADDR